MCRILAIATNKATFHRTAPLTTFRGGQYGPELANGAPGTVCSNTFCSTTAYFAPAPLLASAGIGKVRRVAYLPFEVGQVLPGQHGARRLGRERCGAAAAIARCGCHCAGCRARCALYCRSTASLATSTDSSRLGRGALRHCHCHSLRHSRDSCPWQDTAPAQPPSNQLGLNEITLGMQCLLHQHLSRFEGVADAPLQYWQDILATPEVISSQFWTCWVL